ncbi:hypothetical protein [Myxococcus sp. AB025B]|uniref:hypothetical protein n=1 Tax=Myxococcus sp. AB025B TaxID=2562794 RepID=UPI001143CF62|nr:hypothetical protein [Myxococcus sp. AB025B]
MSKPWSIVTCILVVQLLACAGGEGLPEDPAPGETRVSVQGLAGSRLYTVDVTAQPANVTFSLRYMAASDTYEGGLMLSGGTQTLTAAGYVRDSAGTRVLVATGSATVDVVEGVAVTVLMNLQDVTPPAPQPDIPPFIRSAFISGTAHTTNAIELAVSVIDLDGDPITYAWTSDCPTGVFSRPNEAYTTWHNMLPGPCKLEVHATARGQVVSISRVVNVEGPAVGGVLVVGTYIPRPRVTAIQVEGQGLSPRRFLREDAVSNLPFVGPNRTFQVEFFVDYGTQHGTRTATLDMSEGSPCGTLVRGADTCATSPTPTSCSVRYTWTTPLPSPLCKLTARATNGTLADAFTIGTMVDWVP